MKAYAVIHHPEENLSELPVGIDTLFRRYSDTLMRGVVRIVTVDRQTIYIYSLRDKKCYNPITLEEIQSPE